LYYPQKRKGKIKINMFKLSTLTIKLFATKNNKNIDNMKKLLLITFILFSNNSFAEENFNWEIAKNSKSENCEKIVILEEKGNFNHLSKEHINLQSKCAVDILEENGF